MFWRLPNWGKLLVSVTFAVVVVVAVLGLFGIVNAGDDLANPPEESELYSPFFR